MPENAVFISYAREDLAAVQKLKAALDTARLYGAPVIVAGECIGGIGVSGGDWATDERIAREAVEAIGANWK